MLITYFAALTAGALAAPPPTLLEVDNDFEGEVEVIVDGRFQGTVAGNRTSRFDVGPGRHDVRVQRPRGGAQLVATAMHGRPGTATVVHVDTPTSRLRVTNDGTVPLSVDVGPGDDVWIAPRTAVELVVPAGTVRLMATARDHDGVRKAHDELVWVEPGPRTERVLSYTPPPPTRLVLENRDREPLRALVDGREVGWVSPGQELLVAVDPGWTQVRFYDPRGRLVTATDVKADRGKRTPVTVAFTSPRPASAGPVPAPGGGACHGPALAHR